MLEHDRKIIVKIFLNVNGGCKNMPLLIQIAFITRQIKMER